jgi:membrane associated rhomboid family serine protease
VRARPALSLTARERVMTTRGRRFPVRRCELTNSRTRPALRLLILTATALRVRILRWLAVVTDTAIGLRFLAAAASPPPGTIAGEAAAAATRKQPPSAIVTGFVKVPEAIVRHVDVCYRHPGRETGVSCSNCGRPICPDCMTPTSVGMRCPECGGQTTTVRKVVSSRSDEPMLTYVLIGIIALVQLGAMASGANATGSEFGGSQLISDGAVSRPAVADGEIWRLLTSGFLHAGLLHLMFNGFALYVLGTMLEPAIGRLRFAIVFFVSLLAGSFGALLVEPDALTVGASGAIFGLMSAAIVVMRNRGINPMESGLGLWLGINLVFTFAIPGISIGGHIGGLVGGALVAALMFDLRDRVRMPPAIPLLLAAGVGVAAVLGSIAVSGS